MISFPWWVDVLLVLAVAWPITLLVAVGLGVAGKFTSGPWRVIAWCAGGALGLFLLAAGAFFLSRPVEDWWTGLRLKAVSGVLKQPRTVNGFVLPAGSKVQWADVNKQDFLVADVPSKVSMLGLVVKGEIDHDARAQEKYYDVVLAEPKHTEEWSCGPGEARVQEDGKVLSCTLAVDTAWQELTLPAGTYVDGTFREMRFVMPDGRGMPLLRGALNVPAGGVVTSAPNGTLIELDATWKQTGPNRTDPAAALLERGVKLDTSAKFNPTENPFEDGSRLQAISIFGVLFEAARCKEATLPAGTSVEVPVRGELRVTEAPEHVVEGCLQ